MEKDLRLRFRNSAGEGSRTLSIPEPPANISETATLTALQAAINTYLVLVLAEPNNWFDEAEVYARETTPLLDVM